MSITLNPGKYSGVSPAMKERLFGLVAAAESKELQIGPHLWQYLDLPAATPEASRSAPPVVFFAGGAKLPHYSFAVIEAVRTHNRVIAPAQPPCNTLDEYFAGIGAILDREAIAGFHCAGSSWGGQLAQVAALLWPDRLGKMVLASTGLSGGKAVSLMLRLHLASIRRGGQHQVLKAFKTRALSMLKGDDESNALWQALFDDLYDRYMTYEDYVSLISTQLDYVDHYADRIAAQRWNRPVLILTAKDESAGRASWQTALRRAYPEAQFHVFDAGGHHPALTQSAEYQRVVAAFLRDGV